MYLAILFWGFTGFCLYAYAGYPFLLLLLSLFRKRPIHRDAAHTPTLTIIVPVHNEEQVILQKIDNLLTQDYPAHLCQILIVSDGSTDNTERIVMEQAKQEARITLLALPRGGKALALNAAAAQAHGDVLVFTDANAILAPHTLRSLTQNLADPQVGGVCGNQLYRQAQGADGASRGETLYWHYDKFIKQLETQIGSIISADGSIYAVRRSLYVPITDPAATDDFTISTRVITQGFRLVYEPNATAEEETTTSAGKEFSRKVRVTNRGLRSLFGLGSFLWPWKGGLYALQVLSHKLFRRLVPFVLPILLLLNIFLWSQHWVYALSLIAQVIFYGMALSGFALRRTPLGHTKLFYIPYYFVQANLAAVWGWFYLLRNQRISIWQPQRADNKNT